MKDAQLSKYLNSASNVQATVINEDPDNENYKSRAQLGGIETSAINKDSTGDGFLRLNEQSVNVEIDTSRDVSGNRE